MTKALHNILADAHSEPLHYATLTPGIENDVFDAAGNVKEHWRYALNTFSSLGAEALKHREQKAQRILRDDGATYNISSDVDSSSQTWGLDLVPALISSEEWSSIEAGLLERSELFNLLLKDIYGPRDLIRTGIIPPESIFAHRGFLRACHGLSLSGEHDLILHGVDMMRDAQGNMCVITDRTQAPSGAGYALENRTVMSRVLPSMFRDSQVHRLAPFFQTLRAKLYSLSPHQDQPRVVVLTPGAHSETYFEHAYIANYLGLDLVQSGDLIVRNGYVWMKSLDGLSRVDVILRRVDDWYCDPVELRSDSQLGIANLLEVVRSHRVAIANSLGSGILENPILLKFLPDISKALLGRELRLPSVATHWAGDKNDIHFITDNLRDLIIKPTHRDTPIKSVVGANLTQAQCSELINRIRLRPLDYVAQPILAAHHLPSFTGAALQPRPAILRTFAVAGEASYSLMPGGLTRVGTEENTFIIANQIGARSKDTWVMASEPERKDTAQNLKDAASATRQSDLVSLPSRVVENLFWMGRYAERAEASLRILRTVFIILNGEETVSDTCRRILLKAVTEVSATQPGFTKASDALFDAPEEELLLIIKDANRLGSVRSNLNAMLFCSDESKELLSSDTLRVLNDIRDALNVLDMSLSGDFASAPEEALDPLVTALLALAGLTQESMVRGIGWRFMQMGRKLERGLQTTTILKSLLAQEVTPADQEVLIEAMLLSMEALISYRRRYRARMAVQTSLDLVMMDITNPRSLLFQLEQLATHIHSIPKPPDTRHELSTEERAILEAQTLVKLSLLKELSSREDGQRKSLNESLDSVKHLLGILSNAISDKYFDHRETSRQLVHNIESNGS